MRHFRTEVAWAATLALLLWPGSSTAAAEPARIKVAPPPAPPRGDPHSFAVPSLARVTHIALDLDVDFRAQQLRGRATLDIRASRHASELVLDTRSLRIRSVRSASGRPLPYRWAARDPLLGEALAIEFGAARRIVIRYETNPGAMALQWLSPRQTSGRRSPFLFSQGETILNRSWIPTQDSPGIRQTWQARISVPPSLTALMSGEVVAKGCAQSPGRRSYCFRSAEPMPSYLIGLAVGEIVFRAVGPRTGVYAEPLIVEAAASEFADLERMLSAAEQLCGRYRWGRYDVIVLPPAFPYGGMENPRLTFLTPTLLAGDRSLVAAVAHELSHSWSGNLVTNARWSDFWLNEGFTRYIEGRVLETIYGKRTALQTELLGWDELRRLLRTTGGTTRSALRQDLVGRDPDEAINLVAYEKGAALLRTLETVFGRPRWDAYLRGYFDRHAFKSITTDDFIDDLRRHLLHGDRAMERRLRLGDWIDENGIPPTAIVLSEDAFSSVDEAVRLFQRGTPASSFPAASWNPLEKVRFLNGLREPLGASRLGELESQLGLGTSRNSEVLLAWFKLAISNKYEPAVPAIEQFLTSQGRRKYVEPLFEALARTAWGRPIAQDIFRKAAPLYHPVTRRAVEQLLHASEAAAQRRDLDQK